MNRRRNRRKASSYGRNRRRTQRAKLPLMAGIFVVFLLVIFGVYRFLSATFWGQDEVLSANVNVLQGRAEFSVGEEPTWTNVPSSGTALFPGDSLRTKANTRMELELSGGTTLVLGGNSEIALNTATKNNVSEKKNIIFTLVKGEVWGRIPEDVFRVEDSSVFMVRTDVSAFESFTSVFNIETQEEADLIRVMSGSGKITSRVAGYDDVTVDLTQGQQVVFSEMNAGLISDGAEITEAVAEEFEESEWHLENLDPFDPQAVTEIRRRIELKAPKVIDSADDLEVSSLIDAPTIENIKDGDTMTETADDILIIEGTVPENMRQVVVNGFSLTQYQTGSRKWVYNAAAKLGTLNNGTNTLEVYAVDNDGNRSPSTQITFEYEGAKDTGILAPNASPAVSNADGSPVADPNIDDLPTLPAPVITAPAIADPSVAYETSSDIVTIAGTVDPKTIAVRVNGFQLRFFVPGRGSFRYTANARIENGNMKTGENKYLIESIAADGAIGSTEITVIYTPVAVPGTDSENPDAGFNLETPESNEPKQLQYDR
jgi:hypothetical protein